MQSNDKVIHYIIRVPKADSAFIYFQLEANENLCFYSTLESSLGEGYRDIEIKGSRTLKDEIDQVLKHLKTKVNYDFLHQAVIDDMDKEKKNELFPNKKTVYGPVKSWRFGQSLGIDPIFETSTCSFNCIYCQLGNIQNVTTQHKEYVPTSKILEDFKEILENKIQIDVITYSGSGEPTLATNLEEIIDGIREIAPDIPQYILTNGTEVHHEHVLNSLKKLDKVIFKLDAGTEKTFNQINRPANGINFKDFIKNAKNFRELFDGDLEIQSMFMPINQDELDEYANILIDLKPNLVQLNTPKRPYPLEWHRENRGNHLQIFDHETRTLKKVTKEKADTIEEYLEQKTNLKFTSVYS